MSHEATVAAYEAWIKSITAEALARREDRLAALKTPEDAEAWARELRDWYRQSVGPMVPLDGEPRREQCGSIRRDGYRIDKWLFETMPGTFSSANLYVPDEPNAQGVAIVAPVGHAREGKARHTYQNLGGYMARHGVAVLVYDHPGLGERREYWNRVRNESIPGRTPTSEHDRTGDLCTLAGIQPSRFYLTEASRARDFLAGLEFVRGDRIGVTGCSGGGTMSRMAAAYLDDWAFAIPVCIIRGDDRIGGGDAEQCTWDAGVRGVAAVDLLATMVPRPTMIVTETSFEATGRSYASLRRVYDAAGAAPEATEYFAIDDEHGYTHPMIEAVYRFIGRHFELPQPDPDVWNHIRVLPADETWTGPSGLMQRDRLQVSLQSQIKRLAPAPEGLTRDNLPEALRIADWKRSPVPYTWRGRIGDQVVVTGSSKAGAGELGLLDWVEAHPPEWHHGQSFLYRSAEADASRLLLHFGRCLVGLRVRQILDFLVDNRGKVKALEADREWSVPVALACALADPQLLGRATVRYLPVSFRELLDAELNTTPLGVIVPGLLGWGDMADVIGLTAGRLEVIYRVDADGRVVSG